MTITKKTTSCSLLSDFLTGVPYSTIENQKLVISFQIAIAGHVASIPYKTQLGSMSS